MRTATAQELIHSKLLLPMDRHEILREAGYIPELVEEVSHMTDEQLFKLQFKTSRTPIQDGIVCASEIATLRRICQVAVDES